MIDITIAKADISRCLDFAKNIIQTRNQYNRFHKNQSIQIERTFIGKIAEYVFLKYLNDGGKIILKVICSIFSKVKKM